MKIIQITCKNTHTIIMCFLKQVLEIPHSQYGPHHLPITFIHLEFIYRLDRLCSGEGWIMSKNK
jgi:hypothetical protein